MKNYSANNSSDYGFDKNIILLAQYATAKANLDMIFSKTSKLGAMYLHGVADNDQEVKFSDVMKAALETAQKLDVVTKDKNISMKHEIFYVTHKGNFYRGLIMGSYVELRLVNDSYERDFTFPSIEIEGYLSYQIQRLGGEK